MVSRLKSNVLICAVERGDDVVIPDGNFEMKGGDKISFIAPHAECADFFRKAGIAVSYTHLSLKKRHRNMIIP